MPKDTSLTVRICDWITKYSIYALVFFLPILFLPWTSEVLDFNKQTLLVLLVFVSLFAWMLKVLVSGRFHLNVNKIYIFAGILALSYLLSTVFSVDRYGSFWGWPRVSADGFITMIGLLVLYFIVSNVFSKKEIINSVYVFSVSALIAEIFGVLQLFGLFIIPANFAKDVSFNTLGGAGALGIFSAALLPLMIVMLITAKKWWKAIFILSIFFSGLALVLINFPVVWWITIFGTAMIMVFGIFKRNLFDGRWMALPMFFLAVSLFFLILNPQIGWFAQKTNEISLSQQANLAIDMAALKERPVFGSGPGTFSYDFSKFKSADFNKTVLWNVAFNNGSSKVLTMLANNGILGILAFLAFVVGVVFLAVKSFFKQDQESSDGQEHYSILSLGVFASLLAVILSFFLRNSNLSLEFVFFFLTALLVALVFKARKDYELKPSALVTLITTFAFTLIFIFGLGLLILDGQRYVGEISYFNGLSALAANKLDDGIKNMETAVSANSGSDLYFRQLSQVYLLKIQDVAQDKSKSQDDKSKMIQVLVANSVNAAKIATDLNPLNAGNWLVRGYVYQSLVGLITDANTWAISSYDEAIKLDPNNPYSLTQKGIVYFQNKDYQNAKIALDQALNLKADYSNALYFNGLVYDQLGQKTKAVENFTALLQLNPDSKTDIQKIIDNLNAGRPALDGLVQQAPAVEAPPATTPDQAANPTDKTPEKTKK